MRFAPQYSTAFFSASPDPYRTDGPPAEVLRNPEVMAAYLGNVKTHVTP